MNKLGPSTPPNHWSVHFLDKEATPLPPPLPRAQESRNDSEMRESESTSELVHLETVEQVMRNLLHRNKKIDRAAKTSSIPTKYYNDPTLVEKLATPTIRVAELERKSLRSILHLKKMNWDLSVRNRLQPIPANKNFNLQNR